MTISSKNLVWGAFAATMILAAAALNSETLKLIKIRLGFDRFEFQIEKFEPAPPVQAAPEGKTIEDAPKEELPSKK